MPGARAPSHAERVRTLVHDRVDATLSTLAVEPAGHPFGSVVTYALDAVGRPLVLMPPLAAHARNLAADDRASVLVTADGDGAGRLAAARATLVGAVRPVPPEEQDDALAHYLAAHPGAFWARFPDFFVARLEPRAIRYVRGFGEMGWVDPADYAAAEPDPLVAAEAGIVEHMNADHADAMREMVDALCDVPAAVAGATMLSCDRYGFEVRLDLAAAAGDGDTEVAFARLGFEEVLDDPADARAAMVALVRRARG